MRLLRKVRQEHTSKTYRLKVTDIAHRLHGRTITLQWNLKLIPSHLLFIAILQAYLGLHNARYMLLTHALQVFFSQRDMIAIEALVIIQRIIIIHIFYIGLQGRCLSIRFILLHLGRVTLCTIIMLISQQHRHLVLIIIFAAIIMIIITSRVIQRREWIAFPSSQNHRIHLLAQTLHKGRIWLIAVILKQPLLCRRQTIITHILLFASTWLIRKSHHRTRCLGRASPNRIIHHRCFRIIQWQTMLKRFLAITQDILAHIAQINIHITTHKSGVSVRQERIHQPKFDIFDIRLLKVRIIQFAHYTTPTRTRIGQFTIAANLIRRDIIRTTFIGIITQVQHRQYGVGVRQHLLVRINLLLIYDTCSMIRHQVQIIFYVSWRIARRLTKNRIHRIPWQQSTVLVVVHIIAQAILWEHIRARSRCQTPITRIVNIDIRLCRLKIIDIGRSHLSHFLRMTWNQVSKLRIHLEGRRSRRINPWHLIDQQRQPLHFCLPTCIQTPNGIG